MNIVSIFNSIRTSNNNILIEKNISLKNEYYMITNVYSSLFIKYVLKIIDGKII